MRSTDFAFANDVRAAIEMRVPRTYRLLVRSALAFVVVALIWSYFAILDEVTRGNARVIPSRQIQVVQNLEGGIVEAIFVQEGSVVQEGQVLVRIDGTNFSSQFGELRERRMALMARVVRLKAEAGGQPKVEFPEELERGAPQVAAAERSLFDARILKLRQDIEVLTQQKAQKETEKNEIKAQETRLSTTLELANRELAITKKLAKEKVVPEIELIRLEKQMADVEGQLAIARITIQKADVAIKEATARYDNVTSTFRAVAEEEFSKSRSDLAVVEEGIRSAQDRVRRTELRSPVNGIVNKLNVTTIGGVVQPSQAVAEIVPLDDTLLVEGRIRPADIAFIRPQQSAVVKISAYDASIYGSLRGFVERISPDTIAEKEGEPFYRVMVRTQKSYLGTEAAPLPIIPGMVGTVEILTGRKSVLAYILKPVLKVTNEALRER